MIDEETEIARSLRQQAMREVFSFPIGVAANAASSGRTLAQGVEQGCRKRFLLEDRVGNGYCSIEPWQMALNT